MQNLQLIEFSAEAFRCHVHHYQYMAVPEELTVVVVAFRFMEVGMTEISVRMACVIVSKNVKFFTWH